MNKLVLQRKILLLTGKILATFGIKIPPLPSACAIIENDNKVLAIDLSYKKGFSLPGGGLQYFENFEEGLIREVKEEANLEIYNLKYLSSHKHKSDSFSHVSVCFLAMAKNIKQIKGSNEGDAVWITPKELYENCAYPDVKKHVKDYFKL